MPRVLSRDRYKISSTSLIRLNPEIEVAAEDTAASSVLGDAAKKAAEKNP